MTLDILRKTGGWCVELAVPIRHHSGETSAVEIRPPTADHVIRWQAFEIGSMLALLSELCGLSESVIRQMQQADFDRVMFAFLQVVGPAIKAECEEGKRLLATPKEELPESAQVPLPDQTDPRFPHAPGPVVRLREKPIEPPPEDAALNLAPPKISEAISG